MTEPLVVSTFPDGTPDPHVFRATFYDGGDASAIAAFGEAGRRALRVRPEERIEMEVLYDRRVGTCFGVMVAPERDTGLLGVWNRVKRARATRLYRAVWREAMPRDD